MDIPAVVNAKRTPGRNRTLGVALFLICLTLAAYFPVTDFNFVNFDDNRYVTANPPVRSGLNARSLLWALTSTESGNWHPLTWLSHLTDVELFGLDAGAHHSVSLALHVANTVVLFLVLQAMTGAAWRSACVAALFAVHPLHVESVAWVAERKDVLSALFWMLSLLAYVWHAWRPGVARFSLVCLLFTLGMASKAMLVTLPFVFLLLDWWPLGRFGRRPGQALVPLAREKLPLLLISTVFSVVSFLAQRKVTLLVPLEMHAFPERLANAVWSYAWYLGKTLWPSSLAVFYPFPFGGPQFGKWLPALAALAVGTIVVLRVRRRLPHVAAGWLWYLVTLLPVIGLVQIGDQAMADRYTYLPSIGVFLMVVWGTVNALSQRLVSPALYAGLALATLAVLTIVTSLQVRHWKDSRSLFEHAVSVTPPNQVSFNNLANALLAEGKPEAAEPLYRRAIQIRGDAILYANLGTVLLQLGRREEAIENYRTALALDPRLDYVRRRLAEATGNRLLGGPRGAHPQTRRIERHDADGERP